MKTAIGLATLRVDGYVSLRAGNAAGKIVTQPFELTGESLRINAAAPGGEVRVGLCDEDQHPIDGYTAADCEPLSSDKTDWTVSWRGGPGFGLIKGKPVRLEFRMRNADLYAFWCD